MGKTSTCSNKNGKFNNRRPQNCIPKRPVACNFKTKTLHHKPPTTKDRDYRTSPWKLFGDLENKKSENTRQERMVSILDVSMVDVSSPQRSTTITAPSVAQHYVIYEPGTGGKRIPTHDSTNQPSNELGSKADNDVQAALLEAQDISIIGNALQETVNDESWATSEEQDTSLYQTAVSIQSATGIENCIEQDSSSEEESGELVIFENTLDRRFNADNIQEFSDNEDDPESKSDVETVCLDEKNEVDEVPETPTKSGEAKTGKNNSGYGTEPYSPTSTVFSPSTYESNSDCGEAKSRIQPLEAQEATVAKAELSDFEIIFKKQIEAKIITTAQIEAIKRVKNDLSATYDAIIRFLELCN